MRYLICTALIVAISLLTIGCSGTNDSDLKQGDLNDPQFTAMQPQLELALAQAVGSVDWAMDYSFNSPADTLTPLKQGRSAYSPTAAVDTFSYTWDAVNGWHVAYALFSDSGITGSVLDSVQFRDAADQFQQDYDSLTTDYIHVIQQLDVAIDDPLLQADMGVGFNLTLSGLTGAVIIAQGQSNLNFTMTISDSTGTCDMDMGFNQTLNGVAFAEPANADDGVCPLSGSVSMSGQVSIACTGENGNQAASESWIVNATFNGDGTMDVEAQSGNTVWTYSGVTPCGNYENPY